LSHQARAADTPACSCAAEPAKPAKSSANMSALTRSRVAACPGAAGAPRQRKPPRRQR
jgi:hypothetical protein